MSDDIPSELFDKILCRVPAESLLRFRSVCKSWSRLIDDPAFIKSHITQQPSSPNPGHLLIRNQTGGRLFSLPLHSLNFDYGNQTIEATPVKNLILPGVPRIPTLPVASCNGLILISHYDVNKIWVLWNPLTKECYELPELDFADLRLIGSGLGYDSVDDDYKVVRIDEMYLNRKFVYKTLIYSLRNDSWKWIKNCPCDFRRNSRGVYLNDTLYWLSWDFIIALDLSTEVIASCRCPLYALDQ
ncbi:hypothetical protein BUALT_Bualt12G0086500 [Buddleja alternifolia]|uniref:F-box domain-containing protein n=1 Tax=Buddleja alternifolia TaxID=168488 RepID=A0AAV6WPM3_9LAMI|nr:hypothetical protein BUALT_Bualt12G0086500 [Buddleja alternifolia]